MEQIAIDLKEIENGNNSVLTSASTCFGFCCIKIDLLHCKNPKHISIVYKKEKEKKRKKKNLLESFCSFGLFPSIPGKD